MGEEDVRKQDTRASIDTQHGEIVPKNKRSYSTVHVVVKRPTNPFL